MIILIGGFGFVGCNLLAELKNKNKLNDTIVIDDFSNASVSWKNFNVKYFSGDYIDKDIINEIKKIKSSNRKFVLLAGETRVAESSHRPLDFLNSNIVKPSKLVQEILQPGDELILISTAGALYNGDTNISKNLNPNPKNFYGTTKLAEEMILKDLCKLKKVLFKVVRFTNVYGAHADQKKSALHVFTKNAVLKKPIVINGDGKQKRDFIYASDVAKSLIKVILDKKEDTHIFAQGKSYSINDIVSILKIKFPELMLTYNENQQLIKTEPRNVEVEKDAISNNFSSEIGLSEGIDLLINEYSNV